MPGSGMCATHAFLSVCVSALTGEVGLEASFAHEFGHDVDRLSSGAHGQQLDQLRVMEALQRLNLLHELVLLRVLWRRRNRIPGEFIPYLIILVVLLFTLVYAALMSLIWLYICSHLYNHVCLLCSMQLPTFLQIVPDFHKLHFYLLTPLIHLSFLISSLQPFNNSCKTFFKQLFFYPQYFNNLHLSFSVH